MRLAISTMGKTSHYPNTTSTLSSLTTRWRWHPRNCFSPTGGTTELYKQTFLCLTHLDGSTVARGLSFTSTNRPLYRTQSFPKSLSILSQSGSSCLGNKMDHLYCIATGNLFWQTVLRCTFALFWHSCCDIHVSYFSTWAQYLYVYSHACVCEQLGDWTIFLQILVFSKHMSVHKYSKIYMARVHLRNNQSADYIKASSMVYKTWSSNFQKTD